ncbi:hypothetical protein [Clostridium estertheticum]|nr:hypothetical protein [Clostridium estertheticum]MCB2358552.1 hypothetical protein [Clostridium estertheticum]
MKIEISTSDESNNQTKDTAKKTLKTSIDLKLTLRCIIISNLIVEA